MSSSAASEPIIGFMKKFPGPPTRSVGFIEAILLEQWSGADVKCYTPQSTIGKPVWAQYTPIDSEVIACTFHKRKLTHAHHTPKSLIPISFRLEVWGMLHCAMS